ncbi:Cell cycle checkpoint protein RAD17 [Geodia barretti]|uniref:Cell cycle checkpoint protein RAD17 n=1 Tax=Geodia barretti TaxID=519541 RepID=A0AA35WZE5_GEOBA|nr:Cell cycle checkpoint protein RAD17 [Geodia barretti]
MTRVCTLLDDHEHKVVEYSWSDGGSLAAIGGRDNSIFLFRALGKILYCKRETTSDREGGEGEGEGGPRGSAVALPPHLRHHQRPRLLVDPEWVVEHSHLSPEMFVLYLHQNYLHMHSDIDNIYRDKCQTAKRLFLHLGQSPHAHLWTPVELQTEILPHLALTNMPLRNPDQAALLQSITHFSHSYIRGYLERLGERDVDTVLTQDSGSSSVGLGPSQDARAGSLFRSVSQDVGMGPVDGPEEEETVIEDFEDDVIW